MQPLRSPLAPVRSDIPATRIPDYESPRSPISAQGLHDLLASRPGGADKADLGGLLRQAGYSNTLADLSLAQTQGLRGITVNDIDFTRCEFDRTTLEGTRLSNCGFHACDFAVTSFAQARLRDCRFEQCELDHASFVLAELNDVRFEGGAIRDTSFENARLEGVRFDDTSLPATHFLDARVLEVEIARCDLTDTLFFGRADDFSIDAPSRNSAKVTRPVTVTLAYPDGRGISIPKVGEKLQVLGDCIVARLALGTFASGKEEVCAEVEQALHEIAHGDPSDDSVARRLVKIVAEAPERYPLSASIVMKGARAAAHADSIVLPGGEDIAPVLYGADADNGARWDGDHRRSLLESGLVHACFERGIPLMAICRGFQLTSVYHGAELIADVGPEQVGVRRLESGSSFDAIGNAQGQYGRILEQLQAAVYHHQAVPADIELRHAVATTKRVLSESAGHPHEVAMAIEPKFGAPLVGVQFHPEFHSAGGQSPTKPSTNEELVQLARSWTREGSTAPGLRDPADLVASGILAQTSAGNDDLWRLLATASRAHRAKASLMGDALIAQSASLARHPESVYSNEIGLLRLLA